MTLLLCTQIVHVRCVALSCTLARPTVEAMDSLPAAPCSFWAFGGVGYVDASNPVFLTLGLLCMPAAEQSKQSC